MLKDYRWNLSTSICNNSKYLKSIVDISVTTCGEIITVTNIVSTKMANAIAANDTSTTSINCNIKKVRDYYILRTVFDN